MCHHLLSELYESASEQVFEVKAATTQLYLQPLAKILPVVGSQVHTVFATKPGSISQVALGNGLDLTHV